MKTTHSVLIAALGLITSAACCFAGKDTDLKPVLAQPGKVVLDESFTGVALGKEWVKAKGDWQVKDGTIVGKEKPSDKHAAVLSLTQPNHNSIIRFSFKLDGAKGFNLSFNHAKGHLFRIAINDDGLTITKDKDKKDPKSKVLPLGKGAGNFEPGKWHTLLVEVRGAEVSAQADNGAKARGSHPGLDVDKPGYRFVMRGESLLLDDLKIWEAAR